MVYPHDYAYPNLVTATPTLGQSGLKSGSNAAVKSMGQPQTLLPTKKRRSRWWWRRSSRRSSSTGTAPITAYTYQQCRYCLEYYNPAGPPLGGGCGAAGSVTSSNNSSTGGSVCSTPKKNSLAGQHSTTGSSGRGRLVVNNGGCVDECDYAPDSLLSCINLVSCVSCAHCVMYHCVDKDDDSGGGTLPSLPSAMDDTLCCGGPACSPPTPHHPHYQDQVCSGLWHDV